MLITRDALLAAVLLAGCVPAEPGEASGNAAGLTPDTCGEVAGGTISWTTPVDGGTVSGLLNEAGGNCVIRASATAGIDRVELELDGAPLNIERFVPYSCVWDTRTATDGPHRLAAIAYDLDGHSMSAAITVQVANAAAPAAGSGTTYWVATTGRDSNPGTAVAPFATVQRGVDAAEPGDTILVRDGTYPPPAAAGCSNGSGYAVRLGTAGSADEWITLRAEHPRGATLDGQSQCHSYIEVQGGAHHWIIQGFKIVHGTSSGVWSNAGADSITVRGNEIAFIGRYEDNTQYGIVGCYANDSSTDLVFDGNLFHDIGRTTSTRPLHLDHGLYLHSQDTTIINNVFHHPFSGWGVQTASGFSGLIAHNTFHGQPAVAPYWSFGGHIVLWDSNGDVVIQNNIFHDPRNEAIALSGFSSSSCTIENNIVSGSGVTLTAQSLSGICTTRGNQLETDPLLIDTEGPSYDFHLRAGSPAIDTAVPLAAVTTDHDGTARPQGSGPDVGAFERR